jgi:hypothetical protein
MKILMVLMSHDQLCNTGDKTGSDWKNLLLRTSGIGGWQPVNLLSLASMSSVGA